MPKSEPKSIIKKPKSTKPISKTPEKSVESYVPKITHWKRESGKEEIVDSLEVDENTSHLEEFIENKRPLEPAHKSDPNKSNIKNDSQAIINQSDLNNDVKVDKLSELKSLNRDIVQNQITAPTKPQTQFLKPDALSKPGTLPSFLNRMSKDNAKNVDPDLVLIQNESKKPQDTFASNQENNSLTSIFKRDQDEISNIKRVFRKSIMFLTIALLSFGLSSLASSSFVFQSVLALAITGFAFIALTNVFFIIVAHRTYIWLFLIGQFIILSITQYPFSTNLSTLIVGFVSVLLTYLAYLDLEKVQLGSRLFSIPYIVGESTKILSSVLIFIVCLSAFNQISSKGLDKFMGESLLSIPLVVDKVVLPVYQNAVVKGSGLDIGNGNATVESLICADRKLICGTKNSNILQPEEYAKIDRTCKDGNISESDCFAIKDKDEQIVLNNYLNQDLSGLGVSLSTKLDSTNYQPVLSQVIQNKIKKYTDVSKLSFLPASVPAASVIPLIVSLILFIVLSIFKFIIVWFGYIVTWILWKLLQITGFVRLDIEMVEAEIVGI